MTPSNRTNQRCLSDPVTAKNATNFTKICLQVDTEEDLTRPIADI